MLKDKAGYSAAHRLVVVGPHAREAGGGVWEQYGVGAGRA